MKAVILFILLCLAGILPLYSLLPSGSPSLALAWQPSEVIMEGPLCQKVPDGVLVDNFEYQDSPESMGWTPSIPSFGWGLYSWPIAIIETVTDFENGSKVLEVSRPAGPPLMLPSDSTITTLQKQCLLADNPNDPDAERTGVPGQNSILSFKVILPLAIEIVDTFSFSVAVRSNQGGYARISLIPEDKFPSECVDEPPINTVEEDVEALSADAENPSEITVHIGRCTREWTNPAWHLIEMDLNEIMMRYSSLNEEIDEILSVIVAGNMYRLDDVMFKKREIPGRSLNPPHLFRVGPMYMQMQNSCSRFIFAEDKDLNMFLARDGEGHLFFPGIKDDSGRSEKDPDFEVDTARIYQADGTVQRPEYGNLQFSLFIGEAPSSLDTAVSVPLLHPVPIDPNNIPVAQIPRLGASRDLWITNRDIKDGISSARTVNNKMYVLAKALKNSGYQVWPNFCELKGGYDQVFEDMILTCTVTDGFDSARETFPLSVVNYPITNHPPLIERLEDQTFEVGRKGTCFVTAYDPDQEDNLNLTFRATYSRRWTYHWIDLELINRKTGVISFIPSVEGDMIITVIVTDTHGMESLGHFIVHCVSAMNRPVINHPPVVLEPIGLPQIIRAGSLFTLPDLFMIDPDGDPLYYSCSLGMVTADGAYAAQVYYPGSYLINITAYDKRGGYACQQFTLEVLPWWSY